MTKSSISSRSKNWTIATVAGASILLAGPAQAMTLSDVYASFNGYAIGDIGSSTTPYGNTDSFGAVGAGGDVWSQVTFNSQGIHSVGLAIGGNLNAVGGNGVQGNVEVEGNASFGNPTIMGNVQTNGNFSAVSGTTQGTVTAAGTYSPGGMNVIGGGSGGNAAFTPTFDHAEIAGLLTNGATSYAGLANTGTAAVQYINGGANSLITFNTLANQTNVFTVNASDLNISSNITFNGDSTSDVIINVIGGAVSFSGGFNPGAVGASNILFNLFQANSLTIQSIALSASVLAPFANVNFAGGNITGGLFGASLMGQGEFHSAAFGGFTPGTAVPEPATMSLLAAGGALGAAIRRRRKSAAV